MVYGSIGHQMNLTDWGLFDDSWMPEVYRLRRPLHDDWPLGFRWIPRKWTAFRFPMPPHRVAGNANTYLIDIQPGWPLAPDAMIANGKVLSMHPVHGPGQWSIQSVWALGQRIPCYFSGSWLVFGRRLHINFGLKPDVTMGDFCWWFPEASCSWTKQEGL